MSGISNEPRLKARIAEVLPEVSIDQAWAMVLLVRHARRYCRSNAALYPALGRLFPHLWFKTVTKTNKDGTTYQGLIIEERVPAGTPSAVAHPNCPACTDPDPCTIACGNHGKIIKVARVIDKDSYEKDEE